jgi:hypothetical protein
MLEACCRQGEILSLQWHVAGSLAGDVDARYIVWDVPEPRPRPPGTLTRPMISRESPPTSTPPGEGVIAPGVSARGVPVVPGGRFPLPLPADPPHNPTPDRGLIRAVEVKG